MNKPDEASAVEGYDLGREMFRLANLVKPPQPVMQMVERKKLSALFAAYELALENKDARIPTILHAAIEALK